MEQTLQFICHTGRTLMKYPKLLGYGEELRKIAEQESGEYVSHEHLIRLPRDSKIFAEAQIAADKYKPTT